MSGSEASAVPRRSPLELGALIMLATLGFAAVVGCIAVIAADEVTGAFGAGLGIALLTFLTGATPTVALACLKRGRAEVVSLVSIGAAGLALDLVVLAIWLEIENEAYAKIAGVAFVWSFFALIALGLTLALETPGGVARPLYLGAMAVTVVAGLISAWLVVSGGSDDVVPAGGPEVIGVGLGDDELLRALGAALVLLAALWFGALAASRMEQVAVTEGWRPPLTR